MYTTKLMIEVEVVTQFGPKDAIDLTVLALQSSCFEKVRVVAVDTDWVDESGSLLNGNSVAVGKVPFTAKELPPVWKCTPEYAR